MKKALQEMAQEYGILGLALRTLATCAALPVLYMFALMILTL